MSTVSVIIPAYNCSGRLEKCVRSVLEQDFADIEVIVVDDGSKDDTGAVADSIAAEDSRVKVIHKPNGGVSSARNRGLDEASGMYIRFADADDWMPEDSISALVKAIDEGGADMSIGEFFRVAGDTVSRKGSISRPGVYPLRDYADEMMLRPADLYYGVLWNKLFKRSVIEEHHVRMDEDISFSEDMIFVLEYLLHARSVAVTSEPVYYYNLTKGSLMEQGMNLPDLIKMKSSVIGYYDGFYRNTFDTEDYYSRLPMIYGYLLAFSTDAVNLPFAPGTKKLGEEYDVSDLRSELEELFGKLKHRSGASGRYRDNEFSAADLSAEFETFYERIRQRAGSGELRKEFLALTEELREKKSRLGAELKEETKELRKELKEETKLFRH